MSAYSTLRITRSRAFEEIAKQLIGDLSDKSLETILDGLLEHRLYNAIIVEEGQENDNDYL